MQPSSTFSQRFGHNPQSTYRVDKSRAHQISPRPPQEPRQESLGRYVGSAFPGEVLGHGLHKPSEETHKSGGADYTCKIGAALEYSQEILRQLEPDVLWNLIVSGARTLMEADLAALCLLNTSAHTLIQVSAAGCAGGSDLSQFLEDELVLQVVGSGQTVIVESARAACRFHDQPGPCVIVPLQAEAIILGALCVVRNSDRAFDADEVHILTMFAKSAAIAINNERLANERLHQAQLSAIGDERKRVAVDLHDNLAQTLCLFNLKVDRATEMFATNQTAAALTELEQAKTAINSAHDSVRTMLTNLNQPSAPANRLSQQIALFANELCDTAGVCPDLRLEDAAVSCLSPQTQQQALYIVCEALTNICRHAQAHRVQVEIAGHEQEIRIVIEDDGIGFDLDCVDGQNHLGLAIMQARAERCGGHLTIDSALGVGTRIVASFPATDSKHVRVTLE